MQSRRLEAIKTVEEDTLISSEDWISHFQELLH